MTGLTRDGTAEPASRHQILGRERGQRNIHFIGSADDEQDWQPYPGDPFSDDHTDKLLYLLHLYMHDICMDTAVSVHIITMNAAVHVMCTYSISVALYKKNLNASNKPSEHPPSGRKMSEGLITWVGTLAVETKPLHIGIKRVPQCNHIGSTV